MSRRLIDATDCVKDLQYIRGANKNAYWQMACDYLINKVDAMRTVDAVSLEVYKQAAWERDVAIAQLEEHGITFGCIAPDVVKVVRCPDCKYSSKKHHFGIFPWVYCDKWGTEIKVHDYCSYAKRMEPT